MYQRDDDHQDNADCRRTSRARQNRIEGDDDWQDNADRRSTSSTRARQNRIETDAQR